METLELEIVNSLLKIAFDIEPELQEVWGVWGVNKSEYEALWNVRKALIEAKLELA